MSAFGYNTECSLGEDSMSKWLKDWADRVLKSLESAVGDNVDHEDLVRELAEILGSDLEVICGDCEYKRRCENESDL